MSSPPTHPVTSPPTHPVTSPYLANRTSEETTDGLVLVVPVGSTEQHGPHLPLGTDTLLATRLADDLVRRLGPTFAVIAPALAIGASGEHAGFAGTLSIGSDVLTSVLVELARSATQPNGGSFGGVLFVNGHGGNAVALREAGKTLLNEGRRAYHWSPRLASSRTDSHAGRIETSLLLHLAPHLVRVERAQAGRREPLSELIDGLRAHGLRGVSPNGVLGDPAGATAELGESLFAELGDDLEHVARSLFNLEP